MRRTTHFPRALILIGASLLVGPPGATAAVRHAAPTGFGVQCTAAQPCTLTTAVNLGGDGDEIVIGSGEYTVSGLGTLTKRLHLRGSTPGAPPTINLAPPPAFGECGIEINGGSLRDLRVHNIAVGHSICSDDSLTVERLGLWTEGGGGIGFKIDGAADAVIRSTSVRMAGDIETGVQLTDVAHADLDHVTVDSEGNAIVLGQPSDNGTTDIVASYVRGVAGVDIATICNGVSHAVSTSSSAFNDVTGGCTHLAGPGSMRRDFALVDGFSGGVVRPAAISNLIDAAPSAAAGERDVDGDPRTLGAKPDIGADELFQPPTVRPATVTSIDSTTAKIGTWVNRMNADVTVWVEYSSTPAAQHKVLAALDASSVFLGDHATGALTGLSPDTAYTARVIVTNDGGQTAVSPDFTFTTTPAAADPVPTPGAGAGDPPTGTPTPPQGPIGARDLRAPKCDLKVQRVRNGIRIKGRCDEAGRLTLKLTRRGGAAAVRRTVIVKRAGKVNRTIVLKRVKGVAVRAGDSAGNSTAFKRLRVR